MYIYLIHPVRHIKKDWHARLKDYVAELEAQGHTVYFPIRDTKQDDKTGMDICKQNRNAIRKADEVHLAWDGKSEGCLFDMGIAFALNKRLVIVKGMFPEAKPNQKSFPAVAHNWELYGDVQYD